MLEEVGSKICFKNNLIASAIGCIRPIRETLLGPIRKWEYPSTLRSSRVKNAILIRIKIIVLIIEQKRFIIGITKRKKFIIRS